LASGRKLNTGRATLSYQRQIGGVIFRTSFSPLASKKSPIAVPLVVAGSYVATSFSKSLFTKSASSDVQGSIV
jgi:hypothetical protein